MPTTLTRWKKNRLFILAMIVPSLIMLIFSLFNMTAPLDPERSASAFRLGVVNQDEGLTSPPIWISSRMLGGLGENLSFKISEFKTIALARAVLEAGEIAAVVVFPLSFPKIQLAMKTLRSKYGMLNIWALVKPGWLHNLLWWYKRRCQAGWQTLG